MRQASAWLDRHHRFWLAVDLSMFLGVMVLAIVRNDGGTYVLAVLFGLRTAYDLHRSFRRIQGLPESPRYHGPFLESRQVPPGL